MMIMIDDNSSEDAADNNNNAISNNKIINNDCNIMILIVTTIIIIAIPSIVRRVSVLHKSRPILRPMQNSASLIPRWTPRRNSITCAPSRASGLPARTWSRAFITTDKETAARVLVITYSDDTKVLILMPLNFFGRSLHLPTISLRNSPVVFFSMKDLLGEYIYLQERLHSTVWGFQRFTHAV